MTTRDYPPLPPASTCGDDDPVPESLDAKTLRERLTAREAANERFRKLKEKLLAARAASRDRS
ncbi:MAG TPA: hypothetical protein VLS49_08710 [Usitatibacter sp.]|nr:hypothetical protein [Usitatibacter sp.]